MILTAVALVISLTIGVASGAMAAEQPLVQPVLAKTRVLPLEPAVVGLKAARAGVVITAASMHPRDLPQFVLPLNDSGLMGDRAGDGIWSAAFPVPEDVPPGLYYLDFEAQVTVNGQPKTAAASIQIEVLKGGKPSVEIMTPRPQAQLSGTIEVAAQVHTSVPIARAVAYLGAASAEMQREGNTWRAQLDTLKATNGRQQLVVAAWTAGTSADAVRKQAGPLAVLAAMNRFGETPVIVRNEYNYYWGDVHAHTVYSDGVQSPADAYRHARDAAKLDFFSITDHDVELTGDEYDDIHRQADAFDQPGVFAALYGVEWTTDAGHMCFYMAPRFRLSGDLDSAYQELAELGLTAHFNHPAQNDFHRQAYSPVGATVLCAAEVRDKEEETVWNAMLQRGWRVGTDGSQDKHQATWGEGPHWTVALARRLDRQAILDAIRARRTYSTFDRNMRLDFTLDGEDMGATIARPAGKLPLTVIVTDPDGADKIARIEAIADGKVVASVAPGAASYRWITRVSLVPGRHYVYVRVTEADGNQAWSSPIWVQAQRN
jgi:hypothetical protein